MADTGWGLWAHAAAARLGDTALKPEAFAWPKAAYLQAQADENANRLLLAAWLGHSPARWTGEAAAACVRALHAAGRPWKADLVRQACGRVGLPVPARDSGDPPPWPTLF